MEASAEQRLARRAAPYGLALMPEKELHEYTDEANEAAVTQRWQAVCEQNGAAIIGIQDVPTSPQRVTLDGIEWELRPVGTAEHGVPANVFHVCRALEAADVPFLYWLWGEEQVVRPNLRPLTWSPAATRERDPVLIGVIPTAPGRGLWVLIGRWFH